MNHEEKIVEIINRIKINRKIVKNIRESVMAECMASSKYVEAQTIYRRIKAGKIEVHRIGKEYRISRDTFEKFLESTKR